MVDPSKLTLGIIIMIQSLRAQADLFADRKFAVDQAGWQPETKKIYGYFLKLYIGTPEHAYAVNSDKV